MSAEIMQLLFYGGFTLLGWWLRHKGLAAHAILGGVKHAAQATDDFAIVLILPRRHMIRLLSGA